MLALALMAMPAMASVQNVKVSGDIENTLVIRNNFDLGGGTGAGEGNEANIYRQNVLIMQTRLRVDADLTDKVSATIALINEREWGRDNSDSQDNVDLNLAYVVMKEMLYSPLTVTLGRQDFAFGNSFVIDSAGTNNSAPLASGIRTIAGDLTKQTAQDALRLTFDYDPLTIDVLYSAIDQYTVTGATDDDNIDLYGINANYQLGDAKNTVVEGYFWYKHDNHAQETGTGSKVDTVYMPGVRASMNITDAWNLQGEFAVQTGTKSYSSAGLNAAREAYAGQVLSYYMLPFEKTKKYQPVLGLEYTMYSGDTDTTTDDTRYTAWDPMYENQAGGTIFNALFNATNCHIIGTNLSFVPMEDVQAKVYYDYLWLDKESPSFGLVQPDNTGSASSGIPTPTQETEEVNLGQEIGLVLTYDYTEDVQFGARAGWFFPGDRYGNRDNNNTASQLLLNAKVAF